MTIWKRMVFFLAYNEAMNIKHKVMVFIARSKGDNYEWFTRHNTPSPEHGGDRWYVVTGNVDLGETLEHAVLREVQEETAISSHTKLIQLPLINSYVSNKDHKTVIEEQAYLFVTDYNDQIVLNEESDDFCWLSLDDFVAKIWWPKDKNKLKDVLATALTNKK